MFSPDEFFVNKGSSRSYIDGNFLIFALRNFYYIIMAKKKEEEVIVNVTEVYSKSEQFFEDNKSMITAVVSVLVLAFVGYFAYQMFVVKPKQMNAANDLYLAQVAFDKDSTDLVLEDAMMVAEEYGSTPTGKLANYYAGIAHRDKGEYAEALEYFKKADFNDAIIGVLALGNVGDMYIETDDISEGAKWLEKAAKKGQGSLAEKSVSPFYFHKAARAYLALDDFSKAKNTFSMIMDKYPDYKDIVKVEEQYYALIKK